MFKCEITGKEYDLNNDEQFSKYIADKKEMINFISDEFYPAKPLTNKEMDEYKLSDDERNEELEYRKKYLSKNGAGHRVGSEEENLKDLIQQRKANLSPFLLAFHLRESK